MARASAVLLIFLIALGASAQRMFGEPLGPRSFLSNSGKAKLWVNPTDRDGVGPAYCKLTVRGKAVWQKELPFTLIEAGVSDDGWIGGYAYTDGRRGTGDFLVAILDPKGRSVLGERTPRKNSPFLHVDPDPKASGLVFDPDNNRLIVRIASSESWRLYRLSDGKRTATLDPSQGESELGTWLADAKAVAGTTLILVNWYRMDNQADQMGQFFTLVDEQAKPVWRLDLPGDYEIGKVDDRIETRDRILKQGTILQTSQPNQFAVRFIKKNLRVSYRVTRTDNSWKVVETSRAPFREAITRPKAAPFHVKTTTLRRVKSFSIPLAKASKSVVRNVGSFDFVTNDRIAFLRGGEDRDLCVVDGNGNLVKRMKLPAEARDNERELFLAKAAGSKFVLVSGDSSDRAANAWHVDVTAGTFRKISPFKTYWVQSVSAYPDGRFVVISTESEKYSSVEHLTLFEPDGRILWDKGQSGFSGAPEELLNPEDVDIDAKGQIIVLDNIRHTLQLFKPNGDYVQMINLKKAWGREPRYPTEITALASGGFWLYDFGGEISCYRLDAAGRISNSFAPKLASGQKFESVQAIRVDGKGDPWITNGNLIMRLDSKGVAVTTLGAGTAGVAITQIGPLHVFPDGRILALDPKSNSVHAYTSSGKPLFVTHSAPTDFNDQNDTRMGVARSGDIYLWLTDSGNYLHYSPNGRKSREIPWSRSETAPRPPFGADLRGFWRGSLLLNQQGSPIAKLDRWPDRGWMAGPDAVAPDGRLMAYEGNDWSERRTGTLRLAFFKANGMPESQTFLPPGMPETFAAAYDGRSTFFVTEDGLLSLDNHGRPRWIFKPTGWDVTWRVFPSLGGIAVFDGRQTVTWYATK